MLRKNKIALLIFLFLLNMNLLFAQKEKEDKSIGTIFIYDASNAFDVGLATFKRPFKFSQNDWLTVGSIIGGTALLFTVDKSIKDFALSNQTSLNDKIFNFDSFYGSGYTALFTAGIYGAGLITQNEKIRELGLHASEAFIISGLVTGIFKIIIGRRRPYAGESQLFFKPFQFTNDTYQSLPSGHTTVAFAVSTVMANFSKNIFWKSFWYASAGLTAASRIYHNKHWASDVFLGSAIGYFVGKFVVDYNSGEKSQFSKLNITPYFSFNEVGFQIRF